MFCLKSAWKLSWYSCESYFNWVLLVLVRWQLIARQHTEKYIAPFSDTDITTPTLFRFCLNLFGFVDYIATSTVATILYLNVLGQNVVLQIFVMIYIYIIPQWKYLDESGENLQLTFPSPTSGFVSLCFPFAFHTLATTTTMATAKSNIIKHIFLLVWMLHCQACLGFVHDIADERKKSGRWIWLWPVTNIPTHVSPTLVVHTHLPTLVYTLIHTLGHTLDKYILQLGQIHFAHLNVHTLGHTRWLVHIGAFEHMWKHIHTL